MDGFDWSWLSPGAWFADPRDPIDHPAYVVLAVALALALAAAVYARLAAESLFADHLLKRRLARRAATVTLWLAAIGLLLLLFRWLTIPLLAKPIWSLLWWLAVIAALVYAAYFARRLYPQRLAEHEEEERVRRYLPKPAPGAPRGRRRVRRRR